MKNSTKERRIRLDKITKQLKRGNVWEMDQVNAHLDNLLSDIILLRRQYAINK
jgi:hypothetical protein